MLAYDLFYLVKECSPADGAGATEHSTAATPPQLVADGGRRFDDLFAVLADQRRRDALYLLQEEVEASLADVTEHIAAWERECAVDDVPADARADVKLALYHNHLPRLRESGVIDYDARSETAVYQDPPPLVEACLEYCGRRERPQIPHFDD